jgi:hypothetical protein
LAFRRIDPAFEPSLYQGQLPPSGNAIFQGSADVILAKKFKRLVRRRNTLVSEGVDSLLPCRHAVSIIPVVMNLMRCHRTAD